MLPKWLIITISFVLAASVAQLGVQTSYSGVADPGLPVLQVASGDVPHSTRLMVGLNSGDPMSGAHVVTVSCFPGTGPGTSLPAQPRSPSSYPPRAYLPLIVRPESALTCGAAEQEPNDTHAQASPFEHPCYTGVTSGSGDLDWYQVELCSAVPALSLYLTGPATADLDLYLYGDPPGQPIGSSEGAGSQELISASGLVTSTYFVLVSPVSGSGAYTLTGALAAP